MDVVVYIVESHDRVALELYLFAVIIVSLSKPKGSSECSEFFVYLERRAVHFDDRHLQSGRIVLKVYAQRVPNGIQSVDQAFYCIGSDLYAQRERDAAADNREDIGDISNIIR